MFNFLGPATLFPSAASRVFRLAVREAVAPPRPPSFSPSLIAALLHARAVARVVVCVSLVTVGVRHLFMCFLALHVFLEECLLKPLAHFFESLFFHCVLGGLHMFWWRRQWHPTPVCLPGKSHGLRSLPTVHGVAKSWT